MSPTEEDAGCLWDMLQATEAVLRFVGRLARDEYLADEVLQAAVERKIEIIGEAARKVSSEFAATHAEIPWRKIQGQRHVFAHDYGRIEHDRIWLVITEHIPSLHAQLRAILPADPAEMPEP